MPPPTATPPTNILNPLHLYRHLLREATYLPPFCRPFITDRITDLYRRHRRPKPYPPSSTPSSSAAPPASAPTRTKLHLHKGNRALRLLRAANAGDITRMRRVLLLTTGRVGSRRHQLLDRLLLRPEPPADAAALEEALQKSREQAIADGTEEADHQRQRQRQRRDWLDRIDQDRLLAYAKSQAARSPKLSARPGIKTKTVDPRHAVPEVNAWGQPFAPGPRRTKEKRWFAALINRVMPPVGKGEFEALRGMAGARAGSEEAGGWGVPLRRTAGAAADGEEEYAEDGWRWEEVVSQPTRVVERKGSRRNRTLWGIEAEDGSQAAIGVQRWTPRLWRRLYGQIWGLTATVEQRPGKPGKPPKLAIEWGGQAGEGVPKATARHGMFFEGVDARGRKPAGASKRV